jgi:hypothetical protein
MSDLHVDIQEAIQYSDMTYDEIARHFNVPRAWVYWVAYSMGEIETAE